MKQTRTARRRDAAINSLKVLLTAASLAATLSGWIVISTANSAAQVAQVSTVASTGTLIDTSATTVAPAAIAAPTQVVVQRTITTRSSR